MDKRDKNSENHCLPPELIREILLSLPVKSLVRFKCVSNSWLSLISDPDFAKSHFELAAAAAPAQRFLFWQDSEILSSADVDALFHDDALNFSPPLHKPLKFYLKGSCRGLVIIRPLHCPHFIICNPATGAYKRISCSRHSSFREIRFGYDASTDDYLVVIILFNRLSIFSLRTNSWNNLEFVPPSPQTIGMAHGLLFNGAIHCLARILYDDFHIVAFNLTERSFSKIPLPAERSHCTFFTITVLGGCLSLYSILRDEKAIEIWMMKEYKVQSSWIVYKILDIIIPVSLNNSGDIIGFSNDTQWLLKYNVRGELLKRCPNPMPNGFTVYTESLLPIP